MTTTQRNTHNLKFRKNVLISREIVPRCERTSGVVKTRTKPVADPADPQFLGNVCSGESDSGDEGVGNDGVGGYESADCCGGGDGV